MDRDTGKHIFIGKHGFTGKHGFIRKYDFSMKGADRLGFRELLKKAAPEGLREKYRRVREHVIKAEFRLFSIFTLDAERVVFCNVWGYGDNPKWIAESYLRLLEEKGKKQKIYFITSGLPKSENMPIYKNECVQFLKTNSVKAIFVQATAGIWVDCNRKESYVKKRRGQLYIQTWHGGLPLKKIERDCKSVLSREYLAMAARDTAMTDIYISNSEFCNELYRRAFGFKGRIFCFGTPRMDPLLKPDADRIEATRKLIFARLGFNGKRKIKQNSFDICLYAPTYREDDSTAVRKSCEESQNLVSALENRFGRRFVVVTRMHPLAMSRTSQQGNSYLSFEQDTEYVADGNEFGDIYELMEASDVLITDYSNTLFEFAQAKKPVFLYAPDKEEYIQSRGLYFDYDSLPYPIAETREELAECILRYDEKKYLDAQSKFFEQFGLVETGHASEKIAKLIYRLQESRSR